MKLYHGTNNKNVTLVNVKSTNDYHPSSGPVEFLGPSFTDNIEVAKTYGEFIIEKDFKFNKIKKYRSLKALKESIIKKFGLKSGIPLSLQYRDIADSYRVMLISEGYDAITFSEGNKHSTNENIAQTYIPLSMS